MPLFLITGTFKYTITFSLGFLFGASYMYFSSISIDETSQIIDMLNGFGIDLSLYPSDIKTQCINIYKQMGIQSIDEINRILTHYQQIVPDIPISTSHTAKMLSPDYIESLSSEVKITEELLSQGQLKNK